MTVLLATLVLGVASVLWTAVCTGRWFTVCTWYWLGWLAGIIGAEISHRVEILPEMSQMTREVILTAHQGAFLGFLLFACGLRVAIWIRPDRNHDRESPQPDNHLRWLWLLVTAQFLLGTLILLQRLSELGLGSNLSTIREAFLDKAYLQPELPLGYRIYSLLTLAVATVPIMLAQRDALTRSVRFKSIIALLIAAAPGGISTGGRVWMAATPALYVVSYVTASESERIRGGILRLLRKTAVPLVSLAIAFSVFGYIRDRLYVTRLFEGRPMPVALQVLAPFYQYLGITVVAAGPYTEFSSEQPRSYGRYTCPWFADQLVRLKLMEAGDYLQYVTASRAYVKRQDPGLGSTHASYIPNLVADFGFDALLSSALGFVGVLQLLFFLAPRRTFLGQAIRTVTCLYGGLFAFQDSVIGTASAVVPIVTAAIASRLWRRKGLRETSSGAEERSKARVQ